MKKIFNVLSAIFLCLTLSVIMVGCNKKVDKIALKEGTLNTEVYQNEQLDYSNIVLIVTYDDETSEEVTYNKDITFSTLDTTELGEKELTITYKELSTSVTITVVEKEPVYRVSGFSRPQFVNAYEQQKGANVSTPFLTQNLSYKVGDDNAFVFEPDFTVLDESYTPVEPAPYIACDITVEEYDGTQYVELTDTALTDKVAIDAEKYAFDFTAEAIGKTYKITLAVNQEQNNNQEPISFEFEVVDGYNVQSVADLSVIDNNAATKEVWAEIKTANGINQDLDIDAVIIHNNLQIKMTDVPKAYKYVEGDADTNANLTGTLRTWKSIYTRDVQETDTFTIHGNYFTIDTSLIALANMTELNALRVDNEKTNHSALFGFGGDNNLSPSTTQGKVTVNDLKLIGNANKNENTELAGGLNMVLSSSQQLTMKNCIANSFVTNFIMTNNCSIYDNGFLFEKTQIYDSFSNMIFIWGVQNNVIKDCILKNAGGPILNAVHVNPNQNSERYSTVDIVNSTVESYVNGQEAWFVYQEASSIATSIFAMDQLIKGTSSALNSAGLPVNVKSFQKNTKANFIALLSSNDYIANTYSIKSCVRIKNANDEVVHTMSMTNPTLTAYSQAIDAVTPGASSLMPFFKSDKDVLLTVTVDSSTQIPNGLGKITTAGFSPLFTAGNADDMSAENIQRMQNFFSGKYFGIYTNGQATLGALIEYFDVQA